MRYLLIILILIFFPACSGGFSWDKLIDSLPTFGTEETEQPNMTNCQKIPERNVQRCERIKDGKKTWIEIPLPEKEEPGTEVKS